MKVISDAVYLLCLRLFQHLTPEQAYEKWSGDHERASVAPQDEVFSR